MVFRQNVKSFGIRFKSANFYDNRNVFHRETALVQLKCHCLTLTIPTVLIRLPFQQIAKIISRTLKSIIVSHSVSHIGCYIPDAFNSHRYKKLVFFPSSMSSLCIPTNIHLSLDC